MKRFISVSTFLLCALLLLPQLSFAQIGATWSNIGTIPFGPRAHMANVIFNNQIWSIAGDNGNTVSSVDFGGTAYNDVWSSPNGSTWTRVLANNTTPGTTQFPIRTDSRAVVLNNKIFILNGINSNLTSTNDPFASSSDVWSSADGASWTRVTPGSQAINPKDMIGDIAGYGCAVFNNKIWVVGGYTLTHAEVDGFEQINLPAVNDVWSSPDGVTWTHFAGTGTCNPGTGFFTPRKWPSVFVWGGRLYVAGGEQIYNYPNCGTGPNGNDTDANDVWSTDGSTWRKEPSLPGVGVDMTGTVVDTTNNSVYLLGGYLGTSSRRTVDLVYVSSNPSMTGGSAWTLASASFPTASGSNAGEGDIFFPNTDCIYSIGGQIFPNSVYSSCGPAPTATFTNTFTPTHTNTPTHTFTPTNTPTHTNTPTNTFTNTPNPLTHTNTFTFTFTPTNTNTPTNTFTFTNTNTFSNTFTSTNTPTNTNTPTPTSTATPLFGFCPVLQWGSNGNANGQFGAPAGIGVNSISGNVYVCDYVYDNVQVFNSTGVFQFKWGSAGTAVGQFEQPNNVYVDAAGKVYVVEAIGNRVQVFSATGTSLLAFGSAGSGNGQFNTPTGIWADPSGNIYVADGTNYRVQKFTSAGVYLTQWGTDGSGNGQFTWPAAVAVDPTGTYVYVADANANARVQKFTNTGVYVSQWGGPGTGNGQFTSPRCIVTDCAGNVYVSDFSASRIQVFDGNGNYITQFGTLGAALGQFENPQPLSADRFGNVYVGDWTTQRVEKFSLCSGHIACEAPPTNTPTFTPTNTPTFTPTPTPTPVPCASCGTLASQTLQTAIQSCESTDSHNLPALLTCVFQAIGTFITDLNNCLGTCVAAPATGPGLAAPAAPLAQSSLALNHQVPSERALQVVENFLTKYGRLLQPLNQEKIQERTDLFIHFFNDQEFQARPDDALLDAVEKARRALQYHGEAENQPYTEYNPAGFGEAGTALSSPSQPPSSNSNPGGSHKH
jgi:DNA-binding beta-propeller fold protein YncE